MFTFRPTASRTTRGLSCLLSFTLLLGCSPIPYTTTPVNSPALETAQPAGLQNPLSADLASVNIGRELLSQYDKDRQGFLTATEAVPFQDDAGRPTPEFRQVDRNGDGHLTQEELDTYFSTHTKTQAGSEMQSQSFLLLGAALLGTVVGGYLTYVGIKGSNEFLHPARDTARTRPQDLGLTAEDVTLKTDDGISLKAWFIPGAQPTSKTVLILHGHGANKSTFLGQMAPWLHQKYNLFTFDFRNSGESGGDTTTLGTLEQKDLRVAIDYVKSRVQTKIGVLGISMGAATAIGEAAGDPRVDALVSDCSFDTLYNAIASRVTFRHYPLPRQGAWMILRMADWKTHLPLEKQDPLLHVAKVGPRPIYFIHGALDRRTLPEASQRLFEAATGPKEIWIVPGAGHAASHQVAPAEYESRVLDFFAKALN